MPRVIGSTASSTPTFAVVEIWTPMAPSSSTGMSQLGDRKLGMMQRDARDRDKPVGRERAVLRDHLIDSCDVAVGQLDVHPMA
ncbi:hypothetical protein [Microbacterium album]|uniref:hypothetical protein n=1 Tax=Microbacterium album TaxID=2053191 RepID=UPI00166C9359|nr:hypothetical protein [Microbacterium album]